MIVRDCATQYHIIMITHRALPTENEIVSEVLYDSTGYNYRIKIVMGMPQEILFPHYSEQTPVLYKSILK